MKMEVMSGSRPDFLKSPTPPPLNPKPPPKLGRSLGTLSRPATHGSSWESLFLFQTRTSGPSTAADPGPAVHACKQAGRQAYMKSGGIHVVIWYTLK